MGLVEEGRQEVRGEEGEAKEVTLATAFSEKVSITTLRQKRGRLSG